VVYNFSSQAKSVTFSDGQTVNASASVGATTISAHDNGSSFVFDSTDFIGAVKPGATPWWAEWAIPGSVAIAD